jgi:type IV secretory pathway VirB10-like protein
MPNGSSVVIDNLPATDTAGYAGLEDDVDFHTWQLLKGVALSTLLGVTTQVTFGNSQSNLVQAIRQSTSESTNQAGQMAKALTKLSSRKPEQLPCRAGYGQSRLRDSKKDLRNLLE